ncbi:MAG TPA: hypothetical protein VJX31_12170, partial [Casimicrobiaceae bacterium]|nr:hypothetical protein [Casimicrobiaceae bacterium]
SGGDGGNERGNDEQPVEASDGHGGPGGGWMSDDSDNDLCTKCRGATGARLVDPIAHRETLLNVTILTFT